MFCKTVGTTKIGFHMGVGVPRKFAFKADFIGDVVNVFLHLG